jgi:hypothetical protein
MSVGKKEADHPSCLLQPIGEETSPQAPVAPSHQLWPAESCGTEGKASDDQQLLPKQFKKLHHQLSLDKWKLSSACSKDNVEPRKVSNISMIRAVLQVFLLTFQFIFKLWSNWRMLCQQKFKTQPLRNLSKEETLAKKLKGIHFMDVKLQDGIWYRYTMLNFELGDRGQPCIDISKQSSMKLQQLGEMTVEDQAITQNPVGVRSAQGGVWKLSCGLTSHQ